MAAEKEKKTGKRGAPKGNQNARKHGFYLQGTGRGRARPGFPDGNLCRRD